MNRRQDRSEDDPGCGEGTRSCRPNSGAEQFRIAWLTDLHLDHVDLASWNSLTARIADCEANHLLITGDISEGEDVSFQLNRLATDTSLPIWFVLGNHDYYRCSIARQRGEVQLLCQADKRFRFLTTGQPVWLSDNTVLVGEDGWGDATLGDYENSSVRLNDFRMIDDFRHVSNESWRQMLVHFGRESAERLKSKLASVSGSARHVLVATHVPPFCEACWYEGRTTDENWAPFFVCGSVGDCLREFAEQNPGTRITVLCGHSHHPGLAQITENLNVYTGKAVYGRPSVSGILTLDEKGIQCKPLDGPGQT